MYVVQSTEVQKGKRIKVSPVPFLTPAAKLPSPEVDVATSFLSILPELFFVCSRHIKFILRADFISLNKWRTNCLK